MKKLLAGILSMVLLFSVSACSKDGTATSDGSTDTSTDVEWVFTAEEMGNKNAEIVLRWQPNPAHSLAATTNQSKVDYLNSAIEQWCHKHPRGFLLSSLARIHGVFSSIYLLAREITWNTAARAFWNANFSIWAS